MGTPEFSVPTLDLLIKSKFNVLKVYTQPPKKSKRGQKINPSPIEEFSRKKNLNLRSPNSLNNNDEECKLSNHDPTFDDSLDLGIGDDSGEHFEAHEKLNAEQVPFKDLESLFVK